MRGTTDKSCRNPVFCEEVLDLYVLKDLPIRKVCEITEVTQDTIYRILRRAGVKTKNKEGRGRKNAAKTDFFEMIDTEEKAYFLGLWCADGCTGQNKRGCYQSALSLTKADDLLLERLNELLYPIGHEIYTFDGYVDRRKSGKSCIVKPYSSIFVYGKEFSENLQAKGCLQRKTISLQFPSEQQVPRAFVHHFVRGYFDGDGSIGIYPTKPKPNRKRYPRAAIVSSFGFNRGLQSYLLTQGIFSIVKPKSSVSELVIGRTEDCKRFMEFIYKDSTIHLPRKLEKFKSYFNSKTL